MDSWAKNFEGLLSSPFGDELIRTLKEDLHDNLIKEAEQTYDQESAFGLIKEASGVIKVIEHLQVRSFSPKDEGSKV